MKLKQWMKENRWTVRAMAKEIGCHESTLSSVRSGKREPALLLSTAIANFTKGEVGLEDLFVGRMGVEEK